MAVLKRVILLSVTAAMVISLLSFVATPAQAAGHTPIEFAYDALSGGGDVPCKTGAENTGFFRISGFAVTGNRNCEGAVVIPEGVTSIWGSAFDKDSEWGSFSGSDNNRLGSTMFPNVTALTIPNTMITIGQFAFRGSSITSLVIPNSVTSMGDFAFTGPSELTQLTIGSGLTSIGIYAFAGAPKLANLTIPNSVITIGENAFRGASNLDTLTLGNKVETIGSGSFWGLSKLTSLTIPDSVKSIGFEAFGYSSALTSLSIGSGVTEIPEYAFQYSYELTSLNLGKNVETIGNNAFQGVGKLTTLIIPNEVTSIGVEAFSGASSLTSLTIPNSVTAVGANAFSGHAITNLILCKTLDLSSAGIANNLTRSCDNLTAPGAPTISAVALTDTATASISFNAPSNGGAAISKYIATSSPGGLTGSISQADSGTIIISGLSPGTTYTFKVVARNMIGNSSQSAASSALTTPNVPSSPVIGAASLTSATSANVTFSAPANGGSAITQYIATSSPGDLSGIVNQSGSGSINITGLSAGTAYTFTVIAKNAVGNSLPSSSSNSVTTPGVPDPPTAVVATRTSSTSVNITFAAPANNGGETITSYTARSYSYTDDSLGETGTVTQPGIRSIDITGLTETATYSFWVFATNAVGNSQDSDYSNVIIGSPYNPSTGNGEVACINDGPQQGSGFFSISNYIVMWDDGCRGSAVIPNGVLEIDSAAFNNSNITSVVIPSSVTTIGSYAFRGNDITSLVIPNSVTTIGQFAFANLGSLTSLTLGNSVQTIEQFAFANASNLTALNLPSSVRTIGAYAFQSASSLRSLVIPDGVTEVGDSAFIGSELITSITIPNSVVSIGEEAFFAMTNLETVNYCGNTGLNRSYIGLSVNVDIRCSPSITVTMTNFQPRTATNVGVILSNFDISLNYQATVKFVNVTTNADVSNGTLTATKGGTSLIPGYSSYSAAKLGFKGTYAQIAAALASMTWNPESGTGNITMRIGIASMPGTTEFYYDANSGHYYKYVSTALPWETATAAAEATTLFGLRGYLAEINSAAENSFIGRETTATNVWIGASDRTTEGTWIWAGATNAYPKPTGSGSISGRTAAFHSWANGEPNDWPWHGPSKPEREDCAVTNWRGAIGMWNDWPCLIPQPYLIEFGGRPGETSTAIGATLTTTVNAVPPVQYTITYDPAGGSETPTAPSRVTGVKFALAGAISRAVLGGITYQFAGWKTGGTLYKAGETFTVGSVNLTFTAEWVQLYEVKYLANGGSFSDGETVNDAECTAGGNRCTISQTIKLNSAPTRAGYTFVDWKNQSGTSVIDSNNAVAGIQTAITSTNYIFSASWTPITYTITYTSSGSSVPTQSPLEEGDTFKIGSPGTRSGFQFNGWSYGDSIYFPDSEIIVGTSNVSLTAQWTAVFTVTYSPGLGSGTPATETSSFPGGYELIVGTDAGISRSGFTFSSWSDGTTTYQVGDTYTIGSSNITLTAQWTAVPIAPAPPAPSPTPTPKSEEPVTNQAEIALALKATRDALQVEVAKNQKTYREMFASLTTANASISVLIPHQKSGAMINAKTEGILSSQSANVKIPAAKFSLSSKALDELKGSVRVRVTSDGISVTPVSGFTGVVVVPVAATVDGVETVVLNKVVINPVPPKAQSFAPTEINKSSIAWAPSSSKTTGYLVTLNGKEVCQTTATTCPVAALIGPKSVVTITALGNDQTVSTPVVIPYVATKPIPALKVNFAVGSSILSTAQKNEIRSVARVISTQGFTRLVVSGFTDSNGSLALNKKLSEARAKSVAVFMRTLLPEIQIKASAFGPTKPIASNKSKSGQAQNRRTQIAAW
jgi:uncharacterized repeat protein (TIGR02543 family)